MDYLKKIFAFVALLFLAFSAFCKETPVQGLNEYKLENGLTLFTLEDHNVPLVYIEIAFRTGAVDSTPETAGLFYLYEHLMFRGNALYTTPSAMQEALYDMGVTDWNGSTAVDYTNFSFTVPSTEIERGLSFWNAAVRSPNLQDLELTGLRENLARRIEALQKDQGTQYSAYSALNLFSDAPYKTDASGSADVIRHATVAEMGDLQSRFYIPKNAALFVGGDIEPENVYELVKKIFGSWSNKSSLSNTDELLEYTPPERKKQNPSPFSAAKFAVIPYQGADENYAQISVKFRGPDTDFDLDDTYVADYLCSLMLDPEGLFKKRLSSDPLLDIPSGSYLETSYVTKREDGVIEVKAFVKNPGADVPSRADYFALAAKKVFRDIAEDPSFFEKDFAGEKVRSLLNLDALAGETVQGKLSTLRFWWACASGDYYYTYKDKLASVSQKDVKDFVAKYIEGKNPLVTVVLSPSNYEAQKADFEASSFELITEKNSFWQNESLYAAKKVKAEELLQPELCDIYFPNPEKISGTALTSKKPPVKKYTLKNGVPLYFQSNPSSQIDAFSIGIRGGLPLLEPKTSGLSNATLTLASRSSKSYSLEQRNLSFYKYSASMQVQSETLGNSLSLKVIDRYWKDALPLLTDAFLNPSFSQSDYDSYYEELSLASSKKTSASLLSMIEYSLSYQDHPFEPLSSVTGESLPYITLSNIKKCHEEMLNPSALFVVASGKMDVEELLFALNESIGLLEQRGPLYEEGKIPPVSVKERPRFDIKCKKGESVRMASRLFEYPSVTDEDYFAARISSAVFCDVMIRVARDHRAACKGASENVISSRASVAEDLFSGVLDFDYLRDAWQEARALMELGMVVQSNHGEKGYLFTDLEKILPRYKNMYIARKYASQTTSAAAASTIVYNLLEFGDADMEAKKIKAIEQVTAGDVLRVFKKYWAESPDRWFTVGPGNSAED